MLKKSLINNLSFVVSIIAALAIFVPSILLKDLMTTSEYGQFSLLATIISVVYSFGALGSEQVVNRVAAINDETLELNVSSLRLTILCTILFLPISFGVLTLFTTNTYTFTFLTTVIVLSIIGMLLYNISRLMSGFVLAQLFLNFWKFCIAITSVITIVFTLDFFDTFILIFVLLLFTLVVFFWRLAKKIRITFTNDRNNLVMPFFYASLANMAVLTLLGYGDRFVIEYHLGLEKMGHYYYMMTLYVFPFIIFANYIGFKRLIFYKKNSNIKNLRHDMFITAGFAMILGICVYTFWLTLSTLNLFLDNQYFDFSILFILLGMIRLIYAIISAAIGAQADGKILLLANLLFILFITICILLLSVDSIATVVWLMICFWLVKGLTGWWVVKLSIKRFSDEH